MANDAHRLKQWLQEGILAAKSGQLEEARFRLLDVVEQDQTNETAWYWLYQVFNRKDDQRICLENLIILNPDNQWAKRELLNFLVDAPPNPEQSADPPKKRPFDKPQSEKPQVEAAAHERGRPVTLKLITAFWLGISVIFLGSGIISVIIWFASGLNNPGISDQKIQFFRSLELAIGIIFIIIGFLGLYVAVMLFLRSMVGFYGSVLLSMALLLAGPTVSLITTPPNYVVMLCTGGISGMIVLLTLASQPGFENSSNDGPTTEPIQ